MRDRVENVAIVGLCIAAVIAIGGCQNAALGEPCAGGWCLEDMKCELATVDHLTEMRCVVPNVCGNGVPEPGELCDDGNVKNGDGCSSDCLSDERCGNGIPDPHEICDDGNRVSGDGCSADCRSDETCGNSVIDEVTGETCDPPIPGRCDERCHVVLICGNGRQDPGEECDNGTENNGDNDGMTHNSDNGDCRTDCIINRCGDGFVDMAMGLHHEDCEGAMPDPNDLHKVIPVETSECNIDCTTATCGDHKINRHYTPPDGTDPEQCDDGHDPSQECNYGVHSCLVCNSICRFVPGNPHFCGDEVVDVGHEACDYGSAPCGTCNSNCQSVIPTSATGSITVSQANNYDDGQEFSINDGFNSVTFKVTTGMVPTSIVQITPEISDTAITMAGKIAAAIHTQLGLHALQIDATADQNLVSLTNQRETSAGNQPIGLSSNTNLKYVVAGMGGGAAANCSMGQTCHVDGDCLPTLVCSDSRCVVQ